MKTPTLAPTVTARFCLACGAHVPMPAHAVRCMDCGGPELTPAQLRQYAVEPTRRRQRKATGA